MQKVAVVCQTIISMVCASQSSMKEQQIVFKKNNFVILRAYFKKFLLLHLFLTTYYYFILEQVRIETHIIQCISGFKTRILGHNLARFKASSQKALPLKKPLPKVFLTFNLKTFSANFHDILHNIVLQYYYHHYHYVIFAFPVMEIVGAC